jgi:hypothetical protein
MNDLPPMAGKQPLAVLQPMVVPRPPFSFTIAILEIRLGSGIDLISTGIIGTTFGKSIFLFMD